MKVSVIVDTFNSAPFVVEAVESVLSQDHPDEVQCVVVDDGSEDETAKVLESYRDRVTYVRKPNGGQLSALNAGFERVDGDVVFFLDGDDFWLPGKVRKVVAAFSQDPALGLVHHEMTLVGADGGCVDLQGAASTARIRVPRRFTSGDVRRSALWQGLRYLWAPCSGLAIRRSTMEAIRPLPEESFRINADAFIASPVSLLFPVLYLQEPLGCFRLHGKNSSFSHADSSSAARALEYLVGTYEHANRALRRCGQPPLDPIMGWEYIKCRSAVEGKRPIHFFPRAAAAIVRSEALTAREKVKALAWVGSRAVERSLKRRGPSQSFATART